MDYLKTYEFDNDQMDYIVNHNLPETLDDLKKHNDIVEKNLVFLRDLGITNYKDIFTKYSAYFVREPEIFKETLSKYDTADLIKKLLKTIDIFIRL